MGALLVYICELNPHLEFSRFAVQQMDHPAPEIDEVFLEPNVNSTF